MQRGGQPKRTKRRLLHSRAILQMGLVLLALQHASIGQESRTKEYQVKAAYLYNFAKLTEWPSRSLPSGPSPLVIGVIGGDDEFVDILTKTVGGRTIETHPVIVKPAPSPDELKSCQIVFFRSSERKRTPDAIATLSQAGILLVGEDDAFLRQGGMINLVLEGGRVRFEVNRDALDRADLRFSPPLLMQAKSDSGSSNATPGARQLKLQVPPEYPEIARRMQLKGTVNAVARVRPDGTVKEVRVMGGHPLLAEALVRAVMGWRYEPASKETTEEVQFNFGKF
jgi:TonB family protein